MNKQEIIDILSDKTKNDWLFNKANQIRHNFVGDEIHLRALIEFSNVCKKQCYYCGLQSTNKEIERYRLKEEDILFYSKKAIKLGYKTIVLQSGEDDYFSSDKLCKIIREIKKNDVALTLSIGEKSFEEYKEYKKAGADRYLLRIETTDEKLYQKMHPNADFKNRINCLENLKTLGYEVGSGCLVGLPEQTINSLADDILFFKEIDADMIGIGPFIPHPQTPLKNSSSGDFWLALKVMALTRIELPNINIPATTAMETIHPNGRIIALNSGANVVMPNVVSFDCQKKYEIYPNKANSTNAEQYKTELEKKINEIGRFISKDKGFRKK